MLRVKQAYTERRIDFKEILCDFTIPVELKNDIMYCQKYLKIYLKVYKTIMEREDLKLDPNMQSVVEDIQFNIYEINAEQQYAIIRLKRVLEIYYQSMARVGMRFDNKNEAQNIAQTLKALYDDETFVCQPYRVRKRAPEDDIFSMYNVTPKKRTSSTEYIVPEIIMATSSSPPPEMPKSSSQVSLLKPKAERISVNSNATAAAPPAEVNFRLEPSANVNRSRLNLRQALSKARTEAVALQQQQIKQLKSAKQESLAKQSVPTRTTRQTEAIKKAKPQSKPNSSSSSEDSYDVREVSPIEEITPDEPTLPNEMTEETFLRIFQLYTHDTISYMQQRRSKRKRRNVQSNERADYLYGHISFDNSQAGDKKRRKTLLLSPPAVKRRAPVEERNLEEEQTSRSSSSSPVQKECNECMKPGGPVVSCKQCQGFFHEKCHAKGESEQLSDVCPSCCRENQSKNSNSREKKSISNLVGQYEHLNVKCHRAAVVHKDLLKRSHHYKREMKHLLKIVQNIKTQ